MYLHNILRYCTRNHAARSTTIAIDCRRPTWYYCYYSGCAVGAYMGLIARDLDTVGLHASPRSRILSAYIIIHIVSGPSRVATLTDRHAPLLGLTRVCAVCSTNVVRRRRRESITVIIIIETRCGITRSCVKTRPVRTPTV